jgi:hypothetical protein
MTLKELQKSFPDATAETWHQHPNGGGWVQNTAHVAASAWVAENARVAGNAWVGGDDWTQSPFTQSGRTYSVNVCAYGKIAIQEGGQGSCCRVQRSSC